MNWIDRYRVVRRALLAWACWIITDTIQTANERLGSLQAADSTYLLGVVGMLATVTAFYVHSRFTDDRR